MDMPICWQMPKSLQLYEAQTLLMAHRLEEVRDLKEKTQRCITKIFPYSNSPHLKIFMERG